MSEVSAEKIRNVALIGHSGSGKTTLAEALLHRAGVLARRGRVEDGSTVCDHEPEEQRRRMSLSMAVAPFEWKGYKVNLLDTPGYADFLSEVEAALRAADLAVLVVSAVDGVEVQTEVTWRLAEELGMPRLVFVNKLDRERAGFEPCLEELRQRLGIEPALLELPIGAEADFRGVADVLTETAQIYQDGTPHEEVIPPEIEELVHKVHDEFVEGIVVADDALLERYLEGEQPSLEELERTLTLGLEAGTVVPVLCGSATTEVAIERLADLIVEIGPPPGHRPRRVRAGDTAVDVAADPDGDPLAVVIKTVTDPYVGQISVLKVLSGTIRDGDHLLNVRTANDERLHGLVQLRGKETQPVGELVAGDIGAVAKLTGTATGDTLAPRGRPVRAEAVPRPEPVLATAIVPRTQSDEDKLATALHRLCDEDPTLVFERVDETHQILLRGTGDTHLSVAIERLERKFGVHVDTEEVRVRYRETVTASAEAEGKHKKQSGGHGQFAVCLLRVEPLERGAGFEFVDKIVGGAISRGYIPAVQKGVEETMASGGVYGHPVVDVRVTLLDGKEHSVDSSEMAFKVAGRLAFRQAMAQASPVVLEPVSKVEVTVPTDLQGDVMGDLNARRGRVMGTDVAAPGTTVIQAMVPEAELRRYATELRSLTGGRARFRAEHDHYDVLPAHLLDQVRREVHEAD